MFPAKERSKDLKKRTGKNTYMILNNNEPFDTWNAQLLVKIEKMLNPSKLNISDYEIHFTIARISPLPLMVSSEEEYANMLERMGKSKDLACKVYVQELQSSSKVCIQIHGVASSKINFVLQKRNKENAREGSDGDENEEEEDGHKKKKVKKTKVLPFHPGAVHDLLNQISP
jgi:hypothetical protein